MKQYEVCSCTIHQDSWAVAMDIFPGASGPSQALEEQRVRQVPESEFIDQNCLIEVSKLWKGPLSVLSTGATGCNQGT